MQQHSFEREHGEFSDKSDLHNSFGRFSQKAEDTNLNLRHLIRPSITC